MSTAQNVAELHAGLKEAALELGDTCSVYRPINPAVPAIDGSTLRGSIMAAFPLDYGYRQAPLPTKPFRVAIADMSLLNTGDYVVNAATNETNYIANNYTLQPVTAVNCNVVLSVLSQSELTAKGNVGRLGDVVRGPNTNETVKINKWPGSLLYAGRGGRTLNALPTDDDAPQFIAMLPLCSTAIIVRDIVTCDTRRFVIRAVETNITGVRLSCMQLVQ